MATVYGRARLRWKGNHLMIDRRQAGAQLVPDARWPGMWRVEYPKGVLSDMANRTRAKDAAISLVLASLNTKETRAAAA
jgi:hypothetical protein